MNTNKLHTHKHQVSDLLFVVAPSQEAFFGRDLLDKSKQQDSAVVTCHDQSKAETKGPAPSSLEHAPANATASAMATIPSRKQVPLCK